MDVSRHYKSHSRPYRCNDCGKGFALRNDLDRHKTKHQNVNLRFQCKVSGCKYKGTLRKDNLRRHIRNSHGEKNISKKTLHEEEIKAFCNQSQLERSQLMEASNLLLAVQFENNPILRLLINGGIDVATKTDQGKTALHIAAMKANTESIRLLLDAGANNEAKDNQGNLCCGCTYHVLSPAPICP